MSRCEARGGCRLAATTSATGRVATLITVAVVAAGGFAVLPGCGGRGGRPQAAAGDADMGLVDLKAFLEGAKAGKLKTTRADALPVIQAQHMAADYALGKGDIVFQWGTALADGPEAAKRLVAFQKVAEKEGGWALFQDGSIRRITAAEFAAAPKAEP